MKQIDVTSTKLRWIGSSWVVVQTAMAFFNIVMLAVALYGWHQLVFFGIIPSFWVFAGILLGAFVIIIIVTYIVILPGMMAFNIRQAWEHDSPFRKKIEEVEEKVDSLLERVDQLLERGK